MRFTRTGVHLIQAEIAITNNREAGNALIEAFEMRIVASDDEEVECITRSIGVITAGNTYRFNFLVDPDDWKRCKALEVVLYEANDVLTIAEVASETQEPDDNKPDDNQQTQITGKSSGGCDTGLNLCGLIIVLCALKCQPKN